MEPLRLMRVEIGRFMWLRRQAEGTIGMNKLINELQAMIEEQSAKCGGNEVFLHMHPNTAEHLSQLCEQDILSSNVNQDSNYGIVKRLASTNIITNKWIDPDVIFILPCNGIKQVKLDREEV
jgi:hypothetical protein